MVAGRDERVEHVGAGAGARRDRLIERVRAVVAEDVERVADVIDAAAIEELARGELDVEAVIHRRTRVLRMKALERGVVGPVAGRVGDILQLARAGRDDIGPRGLVARVHIEVADHQHLRAFAERVGVGAEKRGFAAAERGVGAGVPDFRWTE